MNPRLKAVETQFRQDRDVGRLTRALEAMIANGEDYFLVFVRLGLAYFWQRRLDDAAGALGHALERYPDHSLVVYQLGRVHSAQGRFEDAIAQFQRSYDLDPADSKPLADMGVSLMMLKRFPEAIRAFEQALAVNPSDIVAVRTLPTARHLATLPPEEVPPMAMGPQDPQWPS